jgi:hypothetical protein
MSRVSDKYTDTLIAVFLCGRSSPPNESLRMFDEPKCPRRPDTSRDIIFDAAGKPSKPPRPGQRAKSPFSVAKDGGVSLKDYSLLGANRRAGTAAK